MNFSPDDDDATATLLGQIADDFTARLQRGEQPDVEDFAQRYPEIAGVLREVLPALQAIRPAPAACPMPSILGDYRIVREVGRGGMGIVYEAEQISLKRRVALKVLPLHPALEAKFLARFQREAKTAAALHHTNIVPVHAVGCEQGVHFYAMQFIDGQGLDQVIARGGIGLEAAARMSIQVADALEYAHARGVVHRDIKPANLILDQGGLVWITDFGLVKCLEETDTLTRSGDVIGTARYMSPEQALPRRGPIDRRTDVYSLGATLYEVIALQPAFAASDNATLLQQIAFDEPSSPRQHNRSIPRDLETIVLKAMAKEPRRRYATAGALADDLRRFVAGRAIHARPLPVWERAWRWARRRPALASSIVVSAVAAVSLIALGLWSNAELRQANERERHRAREAEERERIGRRHLYATHMNLAQMAWEHGHVGRLRTLLESEQPRAGQEDLRGFEWFYFWRLSHRARQHLAGHEHAISAVAFAPDGKRLATGSYDRTIQLWDAATGKPLKTLAGHKGFVHAVAFAPDGETLASASHDGTVKLWDTRKGAKLDTLTPQTREVHALAFSHDSRLLATAGADGTVKLWDALRRKECGSIEAHTGPVFGVAFSPNNELLATAGADKVVRLWSVPRGEAVFALEGHTAAVHGLAFSADSKTLASGSADQTVKLWDVVKARERATLRGHAESVTSVAFAPDAQSLASSDGGAPYLPELSPNQPRWAPVRARHGEVKLWDVKTGQERASLRGHTAAVYGVAFSPTDATLASVGDDMTVILWDVSDRSAATLAGHGREVNAVAFSPDGRTLISGSDDRTVRLWDVATGQEKTALRRETGNVKTVLFAPDGTFYAFGGGDRTIRLWDAGSGSEKAVLKGHRTTVRSLAFSPDGKTLASGAGDPHTKPPPGEVKLWDLATQRERANLTGHPQVVRSVAYSPDGRLLATGSDGKMVKLWDGATGQEVATLREVPETVRSVAFSPDGKTLAIAGGGMSDPAEPGEVLLWDLEAGRPRAILHGHRASVLAVVFAPDGKTLATGSNDGGVKLWDPETAQERAGLEGHKGLVRGAAFSPDGKTLATGDNDSLIKLWYAAR
ncbi:MAG: protein kinase [Gemmataceae bacterium]|nr:protein kinase [Gemmataceae bacterium]